MRAPGVTAIVLAGGRSSRFGSPKLAVEIGGRPLLERAIDAAVAVADAAIVAGADAPEASIDRAGSTAIRSVADDAPFAGPLAGLSRALRETTTALAIVVGGDMPALVPAVLRAMLDRLGSDNAIDAVLLAGGSSRRQVLPLAIDVRRASEGAIAALAAGDRSLVGLLDRLRVHAIPAGEWLVLDPTGGTLLDIDRPADVLRIRDEMR